MPTFIKTGFWEKVKRAPKEWLNLDKFVEDKIDSTPINAVQSVTGSAVDNTDPKNPVINSIGSLPYEVFAIIPNQVGTNDPTYILLQNTLKDGFIPEFTRDGVGNYTMYFTDYPEILDSRLVVFYNYRSIDVTTKAVYMYAAGENKEIYINTYNVDYTTGTFISADNILSASNTIEVRIYP